ncbi:MAG TPA: hypothetical protein VJS30_25235, partial [Paraburkholderia sp.]|nr:hypothetical protein [Paraburkholderia sp.]
HMAVNLACFGHGATGWMRRFGSYRDISSSDGGNKKRGLDLFHADPHHVRNVTEHEDYSH